MLIYKVLKKWIKEKSLVIFSNKQVVISKSVLFAEISTVRVEMAVAAWHNHLPGVYKGMSEILTTWESFKKQASMTRII